MIDINTNIVETLTTVLPTRYELYLDGSESVPCITYQIVQNNENQKGNINGYSFITVRVKLWCTTVEEQCTYSGQIDNAMAELGHFDRQNVGEMTDGDLLCRIFDYSILLPETYDTYRI